MPRRRIFVWLSVTVGVVLVLTAAAAGYVVWSVRRPFPEYDGTAPLPALQGEVEVLRDGRGIPHIYADTAMDLFRAQGYVHAQDRFWQMDFRRHVTSGRLAELFGENAVDTDAFVRTLGWRRIAEQELPLLDPATRRYLEAYAHGVNAWLADRSGGELGLSYTLLGLTGGDTAPEPWRPVDSLSWLKAMAWDLRTNMEDEIQRALLTEELPLERIEQLYPPYPYDQNAPIVDDRYLPVAVASATTSGASDAASAPPERSASRRAGTRTYPPEALASLHSAADAAGAVPDLLGEGPGAGSNSWVVDGSKTATGAPMLVNDTHLAPDLPSIWYQVGLHCRTVSAQCPFRVGGFSFAGVPGVVIGHNDRIAWGFSTLRADVTDLYLERVEGDRYLVGNELVPMDTREETIQVAGGDPVTVTVRATRHGPLLSDHDEELRDVGAEAPAGEQAPPRGDGYGVALRWTALEPGRTADALFALNSATDWRSFQAAAALFEVPSQNIVYADAEGTIGYQAPGKIPIRRSGDGRWPVPGWTDAHEWVGYIPFGALPSVRQPDEGVVVAANQPVTSEAYPYLLGADVDYGQRAQRIRELLGQAGRLDAQTMIDIQMDTYNTIAELLVPHLLATGESAAYYGDGLRLLRDWDFTQPPDSAAAAYFNAVWRSLLRLTFHDELPEDQWPGGGGRWFEVVRHLLDNPDDPFWDDVTTDAVERRDAVLRQAVRDGRDEMTRRQGKDPARWSWGRLHALRLREATFGSSGVGPIEALLDRSPVEVGGGASIVQATGWTAHDGFATDWVPSQRIVVDLADLDGSRWIDLTGVSGHAHHEHYADQTELWRTGETLPMRWDEAAIREAAVSTLMLAPQGSPE
ncbi:MAG: penicillin acylase family protein [Jiangellaceae bacterium]|nr:penicillin acylase family protein [Jiangellaceae bacterium]